MRKPLLAAPPAAMLTLAATTSTLTQIVALRSHRLSRYNGDNPIGLPCSEMDQKAYRYTWRERSLVMNCKHIKFGLF